MNELIAINYENEKPTVSGRDLHAALEVQTAYKDWFPRMREYGFIEGKDFCSFLSESTGGRPSIDHFISIPKDNSYEDPGPRSYEAKPERKSQVRDIVGGKIGMSGKPAYGKTCNRYGTTCRGNFMI